MKVINSGSGQENKDEAHLLFFFQAQDQRYPSNGISNTLGALYTTRAREIATNDDLRFWPHPLFGPHLYTMLTLRPRCVVVDDGKSLVFHAHMP